MDEKPTLYEFCKLHHGGGEVLHRFVEAKFYEAVVAERDKLIRLLNGEEVDLECNSPGHSATLRLDGDQAIVVDKYSKK
jgi:hypothetical protein